MWFNYRAGYFNTNIFGLVFVRFSVRICCEVIIIIIIIIIINGVRLSPLGTAATIGLLYQPQMIDDGDCIAVGGMKGKPKYPEKLTAWAVARASYKVTFLTRPCHNSGG
jgi:hypothetical protein